jgi:hypothetical protein
MKRTRGARSVTFLAVVPVASAVGADPAAVLAASVSTCQSEDSSKRGFPAIHLCKSSRAFG